MNVIHFRLGEVTISCACCIYIMFWTQRNQACYPSGHWWDLNVGTQSSCSIHRNLLEDRVPEDECTGAWSENHNSCSELNKMIGYLFGSPSQWLPGDMARFRSVYHRRVCTGMMGMYYDERPLRYGINKHGSLWLGRLRALSQYKDRLSHVWGFPC